MHASQPDDLFRLMYTSGTTDRPKGVMHTYSNFYWKCADHVAALGLGAADKLLVVGPLYHVGAFDLPGMAVLWVGGMLCIHRDFDPTSALASIASERLTGAWLAPVMLSSILTHPDRFRHDVASLRWVIGGGERTPEQRIRAFSEFFTEGRYIDGYGLTETCGGDTLMEEGREIEKIGSTGRVLAHVEIEIRDEEGRTLPPGETGEICLRGPKVTRGYWTDPEKTAASFFGDWFRSGDIGHLDAEGFLYLTDRKKDMIISGGENIASSEVERVVYQLPQIQEAAVIGVPDPRWGERPVAIVVFQPGQSLTFETLHQHCRQRLAGFKVPKALIVRTQLPRNPSGKILKRVLRDKIPTVAES
jgi:acyl-CoA synthetase (AMP-forming)/AMP-acid ligase II